ncbi:MAG: imidazole glycerol phosphate synthase subunit HisH [Gemmatimonadaceae bacterium]|nr:imidazole glycerol phosphate synthase subunit HisH [Gemmatimonadaceae bacterium]
MNEPLRVTVFDYGAGNLHSLIKALERGDTRVRVDTDPVTVLRDSDALILPGVGAFTPAADRIASGRDAMRSALRDGLPCLGICLGMQLLFSGSDEGPGDGLAIFDGRVTQLRATRIPQIGWNTLDEITDTLVRVSGLSIAYYANSFVCRPHSEDDRRAVVAWSTHETDRFPAVVRRDNVWGMQFHPEKSSRAGVQCVHAFLDEALRVRDTRFSSPLTVTS